MDLDNLQIVDLVKKNMRYQTAKQRVVAENIANATTPGYLPKAVAEPDFKNGLLNLQTPKLEMVTTNPKHLTHADAVKNTDEDGFVVYTPKPTTPLTIDGNGVVLEDQLNQASKASGEYNRMITIYNKYRDMIKTANTKINI